MRRRRSTVLASLIGGALVWPVDAGAQTELPDLHADVGGNNVRISARVPANGPFDDVIVGGNYTADLTSFLSHPPGTCSDHNSAALQPVVGCTIPPPGLVPGGRFFIDLQTDPGCLNGRVFLVEFQNSTSGAAADGVAPCTQSQGADLGLTLTRVAQRALYERTNAGSVPFPTWRSISRRGWTRGSSTPRSPTTALGRPRRPSWPSRARRCFRTVRATT